MTLPVPLAVIALTALVVAIIYAALTVVAGWRRRRNSVEGFDAGDLAELDDLFAQVIATAPGAVTTRDLVVIERLITEAVPCLSVRTVAPPAGLSAPVLAVSLTFADGTVLELRDVSAADADDLVAQHETCTHVCLASAQPEPPMCVFAFVGSCADIVVQTAVAAARHRVAV